MNYRFYQRILKNSWILIKKNRDIANKKHFQNSIVYYLLFNFLVFLTSFFQFYLSKVFKEFLKFFVLLYWMETRFYQKFLQNYGLFLKKNEIFEIQNFNKIPSFTISFLFFQHFWHFFLLFDQSKLVKKLENFL